MPVDGPSPAGTPRTDGAIVSADDIAKTRDYEEYVGSVDATEYVPAEISRELENELNEAEKEKTYYRALFVKTYDALCAERAQQGKGPILIDPTKP